MFKMLNTIFQGCIYLRLYAQHNVFIIALALASKSYPNIEMATNSLRHITKYNLTHWGRDDIFKCILLSENVWIPNKISLKCVRKGLIDNIPSLVQIMAWRRPCDKPLSDPMMVSSLTHICVTRPQWVNPWCRCLLHHGYRIQDIGPA